MHKYAFNDMRDSFDANYRCEDNRSPDVIQCSGKHIILLSECDSRGCGEIKVTWADTKQNGITLPTRTKWSLMHCDRTPLLMIG